MIVSKQKTQKEHHNYDCVQTNKPRKSTTIMIVSIQKKPKYNQI